MKHHEKKTIRDMDDHRLVKRYHYLKSKLPPSLDGISVRMKYLLFHIRKRGLKV